MFQKQADATRPTVAVLNIGDELLAGEIRNTNGRWLGRELDRLGLSLVTIGVVPDDAERIADFVRWARERHDVVLLTGGLGPTPDDVTRDAVALAFGVRCEVDEELRRALAAAGGHMARFASVWSRRPAGSRLLGYARGGSPAFALGNVYALAGDPEEMRTTFGLLSGELGRWPRMEVWRTTYDGTEDEISGALGRLAQICGDVHVCSYPRRDARLPTVEIVLRAATRRRLARAAAVLESSLVRGGPNRP